MKLLFAAQPIYPDLGNNANLLLRLLDYCIGLNEARIFSSCKNEHRKNAPSNMFSVPLLLEDHNGFSLKKRVFRVLAHFIDRNGSSDYLLSKRVRESIEKARSSFDYDVILTTSEPYAYADAISHFDNKIKVLYLMDPPAILQGKTDTPYRDRHIINILARYDIIITTPFIIKALEENGFKNIADKSVSVGFPMIYKSPLQPKRKDEGRIELLFCGWMCSDIRSPEYFLKIVSRLDERFRVKFMGRECDKLRDRFAFETKAEVITLPQQPYEVALQAMADADVLINIGNSIPVHMPSKTLEYINAGKPIVNFHKMPDCPTLYYTNRYPLCLNVYEDKSAVDENTSKFIDFCEKSIGKTVERDYILREYADCTPEYIANVILKGLNS